MKIFEKSRTGDGWFQIHTLSGFGEIYHLKFTIENSIERTVSHRYSGKQTFIQKVIFSLYKWIDKKFYKRTGQCTERFSKKEFRFTLDEIKELVNVLDKIRS